MIFGKLTRFPSGNIPPEALSGNSTLDGFLSKLDKELLGSPKVRLQTLAEIKDHLLEKRDQFLAGGHTRPSQRRRLLRQWMLLTNWPSHKEKIS